MHPAWHPDGRQLAYLAWNHPRMPWDGTTLYLAQLDSGRRHRAGRQPTRHRRRPRRGGVPARPSSPTAAGWPTCPTKPASDKSRCMNWPPENARQVTDVPADTASPPGPRACAPTPLPPTAALCFTSRPGRLSRPLALRHGNRRPPAPWAAALTATPSTSRSRPGPWQQARELRPTRRLAAGAVRLLLCLASGPRIRPGCCRSRWAARRPRRGPARPRQARRHARPATTAAGEFNPPGAERRRPAAIPTTVHVLRRSMAGALPLGSPGCPGR